MTRPLRFAACVAAGLAFVAAFTVAIAVASARPARADDGANVSAEDRVRVECDVSRPEAYVGEPVRVQLRVLFDAAWFEAHAVRVFQRPLDVPVGSRTAVSRPSKRARRGFRSPGTAPGPGR